MRSVLPSYASCIYIRQPAPLGLGHAVLCAQPAVGAEPFFVHLADDLISSEVAAACADGRRCTGPSARACSACSSCRAATPRSTASWRSRRDGSATSRVRSIVEKPKPASAPSTLAVVGRYVLAPAIFEHLERIGHGAGGEIQLTDGIAALMREEAVYAYRFEGKRYDCGSKLGYLQATVEYALGHPQLGREFRHYLKGLDVAAFSARAPAAAGNGGAAGVPARARRARRAARTTSARAPLNEARDTPREKNMIVRNLIPGAGMAVLLAAALAAQAQVVVVGPQPQLGSSDPITAAPQVARPRTTPCVVTLFQNLAFADFTPKTFSYAPPAACPKPWAKVVFSADFTVSAGRQFDRTAAFYLGQSNIYYGTTAEPRATLKSLLARGARRHGPVTPVFKPACRAGEANIGNFIGVSNGVDLRRHHLRERRARVLSGGRGRRRRRACRTWWWR